MGDVEQEFKKIYKQLKCKANCSTLCSGINTCLGISEEGDESLFLNQQGDWESAGGGGNNFWSLTGNAGTDPSINFVGTTDGADLLIKANSGLTGILLKFKSGEYQQDFNADLYNFKSSDSATNNFYYNSMTTTLSLLGTLIYVDTNEGAGKILTSDVVGVASWQDINNKVFTLPEFADDAAAAGGGRTSGQLYRTTTLGSTFVKIVP